MMHGVNPQCLKIFLPHYGAYKLSLYDVSGKLLGKASGTGISGINEVSIAYAKANGQTMFARLEFNGNVAVKQLVNLAR
jgi:hypothetical protein